MHTPYIPSNVWVRVSQRTKSINNAFHFVFQIKPIGVTFRLTHSDRVDVFLHLVTKSVKESSASVNEFVFIGKLYNHVKWFVDCCVYTSGAGAWLSHTREHHLMVHHFIIEKWRWFIARPLISRFSCHFPADFSKIPLWKGKNYLNLLGIFVKLTNFFLNPAFGLKFPLFSPALEQNSNAMNHSIWCLNSFWELCLSACLRAHNTIQKI